MCEKLFDETCFKRIAAILNLLDFTVSNDLKAKNESKSWNKSNKDSSSFLKVKCDSEEKNEFKKEKCFNSSTLSLHIADYENLNGADTDGSEKLNLIKKCEAAKQGFYGLASNIQNSFEFPRQRENEGIKTPEISQFKASQKLLNPNKMHPLTPPMNNQSDSEISSSSSVTGGGDDGDEFGKQIVELIARLTNEADPETEKINLEFTFTPFKMNKTFTSEEPKMVSTSVSLLSSESSSPSTPKRIQNGRRRQFSLGSTSSSPYEDRDFSSASISPYKTTTTTISKESENFDDLSYEYYQSLVQKQRIQKQHLEEMPSKPSSSNEGKKTKKSKKRRSKKHQKRKKKLFYLN
uniref:Uncharacterized protein n=1 Tax=Panagrolaimus sp. ES5 TaxID=591445 RepID=A0AC34GYJ1_9BILA